MSLLRSLLGICVALALWEGAARLAPGSVLISSPSAIVNYVGGHAGLLWRASVEASVNAAWGFLWGNLAAIALAGLVIVVPKTERGLSAIALLVLRIPLIASGPILRVLFGPGTGPQITLAALAVYDTTFIALLVACGRCRKTGRT